MLLKVLFPASVNLLGNYMDSIANMLTSLMNAQRLGKARVVVPYSRFKEDLARLLQNKGLVATVRVQEEGVRQLVIILAYDKETGESRLQGVRRLSTPGRRRYAKQWEVPYPIQSQGAVVVSTSQGLMDDGQARKSGLGGELVCEVW